MLRCLIFVSFYVYDVMRWLFVLILVYIYKDETQNYGFCLCLYTKISANSQCLTSQWRHTLTLVLILYAKTRTIAIQLYYGTIYTYLGVQSTSSQWVVPPPPVNRVTQKSYVETRVKNVNICIWFKTIVLNKIVWSKLHDILSFLTKRVF